MIPQLLAFKSFIDSLLVAAFREDAKVRFADGSPVKKEEHMDRDKGKGGIMSTRDEAAHRRRGSTGPFGYAATDAFAKGFEKRPRKPAEMIGAFGIWDTECD